MSLSYSTRILTLAPLVSLLAVACSDSERGVEHVAGEEGEFSSALATQLDFEFDSSFVTDSSWGVEAKIQDQLLYTIGHLNEQRSVGRLDKLTLSNIQTVAEGAAFRVSYHVKLPVAWGSKTNLPTSYDFSLPSNVTFDGFKAFTEKYMTDCVDWSAHDVDQGSMWYYFRPGAARCTLAPADVVKTTATVVVSTENTTGKYPELHKVWEDDSLDVVAIFGKNKDGAGAGDAGVSAFNSFVSEMKKLLGAYALTTEPAALGVNPSPATLDVSFHATLADGKKVNVTALQVDSITNPGAWFDPRYEALSEKADLIMYNGHAGLGQNVRALARKGKFVAGKYMMLFMNGCDTFAYVDGHLAQTRAALNPDDPEGTKYMDIVTNAMPSYFSSNARVSTSLVRGLIDFGTPRTYEQIFTEFDSQQVVLVTGENDNEYVPGMKIGAGGGGGAWAGLEEAGTVARSEEKHHATTELPAGSYTFTLAGDNDADLYVKIGAAPTASSYDCRPYKYGSAETCTVTLTTPSTVHAMVRGWAASSTYTLTGKAN